VIIMEQKKIGDIDNISIDEVKTMSDEVRLEKWRAKYPPYRSNDMRNPTQYQCHNCGAVSTWDRNIKKFCPGCNEKGTLRKC